MVRGVGVVFIRGREGEGGGGVCDVTDEMYRS